jgi:hypothetical protein
MHAEQEGEARAFDQTASRTCAPGHQDLREKAVPDEGVRENPARRTQRGCAERDAEPGVIHPAAEQERLDGAEADTGGGEHEDGSQRILGR